ncbi:UNVERIFIED_CONTAM: hypothetical protein K2H54_005218 [Gekko kuhli]
METVASDHGERGPTSYQTPVGKPGQRVELPYAHSDRWSLYLSISHWLSGICGREQCGLNWDLLHASSIDSQEAGVSGAFPSKHRRCIVVHLPTCLPEEDPGTRDASVQVGVTCEDKATQWEENVQADPSLDKSLGAYSTANSCPPGPTSSLQAVNNLLRWVRRAFCWSPQPRPENSPAPARERKCRNVAQLRTWLRKHRGRVHPHSSEDHQ